MELLTIDEIREINYKIIKDVNFSVKKYLPLSFKKIIVGNILDICVNEEDGIKKIDFALKEFAYEYILVSEYSNVNFEVDDIVELYDELKEHAIIDAILNLIPESDIKFINSVLDKEIEQIQLVDNSVANIVNQALNKLVDKIPDQKGLIKLIKELPKQFNKISPDSLKNLGKAMGIDSKIGKDTK